MVIEVKWVCIVKKYQFVCNLYNISINFILLYKIYITNIFVYVHIHTVSYLNN